MKLIKYFILLLFLCNCKKEIKGQQMGFDKVTTNNSIHQFKVEDLYGEEFDFSALKGKKIMVVNTASKCGLTPQYKKLQEVYNTYKDQNFIIIGFPANNFNKQEPGTNSEIAEFCQKNYGVEFPMMSKIDVKGENQHIIYQFLTQKEKNGHSNNEVAWNFQKYLIDENGHVINVLSPKIQPDSDVVIKWIEGKK